MWCIYQNKGVKIITITQMGQRKGSPNPCSIKNYGAKVNWGEMAKVEPVSLV